jgi:hypothetical protein
MAVRFFNFGSDESYHFFEWLRQHRDVPALVAKAMKEVEVNEWFKMGEDVSRVARDQLAGIVEEELENLIGDGTDYDPNFIEKADDVGALVKPLLAIASGRIDFGAVAEALLIDAGKWNPDPNPPAVE